MGYTRPKTVYIDDEVWDALKEIADQDGRRRQWLINFILTGYVNDRYAAEVEEEAQLIEDNRRAREAALAVFDAQNPQQFEVPTPVKTEDTDQVGTEVLSQGVQGD